MKKIGAARFLSTILALLTIFATAAQGQNMTDVLLDFIQEYVEKYSTKPKGRRK